MLGIDPGIERTGWGVVDCRGQGFASIGYGCIVTPKTDSLPKRLLAIYEGLLNVIERYRPDIVAAEQIFFASNAKSAISVGHSRGVCLFLAGSKDLPVEEVTPLQVKSAVVGYGSATKEQVGLMVKQILGLTDVPKPDDTCDALAVAIAAGVQRSFSAHLAQSQGRSGRAPRSEEEP